MPSVDRKDERDWKKILMEGWLGKAESEQSLPQSKILKGIEEINKKIENDIPINPHELIIETEDKLKEIIDKILTISKGPDWDQNPQIGFGKDTRTKIEKRLNDKKITFPTQQFSERLLDHATILDLKLIISKNLDIEEFQKLFPSIRRGLELLGVLGELRVLFAHHKKEVKEFQKALGIGLCGYFLDLMENYQTGISRKVTKWGFQIYLHEPEKVGIDIARKNLTNSAEKIVLVLINKTSFEEKIEIKPNQTYDFTFNEKELKISFSPFSRGSTPKEGEFNQRMNISIYSEDYELLLEILEAVNIQPWIFEWIIIDNSVDVLHLIQSIKEFTEKNRPGGRGYTDGTLASESTECGILKTGSFEIVSSLGGGIGIPTTFRLELRRGDIKLIKIFENFNPDIILKIMYGELSPIQIKQLVEKSYS